MVLISNRCYNIFWKLYKIIGLIDHRFPHLMRHPIPFGSVGPFYSSPSTVTIRSPFALQKQAASADDWP